MNRRDVFKILLIALALILFVRLTDRISRSQNEAESELVRKAVRDAAITCYAVENSYPEDVGYLRKYYHLSYDAERYLVTIDSFASNHIPDIYVTERGTGIQ